MNLSAALNASAVGASTVDAVCVTASNWTATNRLFVSESPAATSPMAGFGLLYVKALAPAYISGAGVHMTFLVSTTSDARFKEQLAPLSGAPAAVAALRGVRYVWAADAWRAGRTPGAAEVGLLAQDVERVEPSLVSRHAAAGGGEYLAVDYQRLSALLVEAIKDLQARVAALEKRCPPGGAEMEAP